MRRQQPRSECFEPIVLIERRQYPADACTHHGRLERTYVRRAGTRPRPTGGDECGFLASIQPPCPDPVHDPSGVEVPVSVTTAAVLYGVSGVDRSVLIRTFREGVRSRVATIDSDFRACDKASAVGEQKRHYRGDVVRERVAPQGSQSG